MNASLNCFRHIRAAPQTEALYKHSRICSEKDGLFIAINKIFIGASVQMFVIHYVLCKL